MKLTIVGTGYVGLVTGACFAEMGNNVICVDIDQKKIDGLKRGVLPIYEPGLESIVLGNAKAGRLQFTTSLADPVAQAPAYMIAVGTPPGEDGSADLQYVLAVAREIGKQIKEYAVVVDKSTVPVGTADKVRAAIKEELKKRGADVPFDVVSNPEFLKEGAAVEDFMKPDRVVIGTDSARARELMHELYAPFMRNHERILYMGIRDAEMTKYASNAMLATKISFMNEMAGLCERMGVDVENVRVGIGADSRIGYSFIYPGAGYGGSCFPKDVKAIGDHTWFNGYNVPPWFEATMIYPDGLELDVKCQGTIGVLFEGEKGSIFVTRSSIESKPAELLEDDALAREQYRLYAHDNLARTTKVGKLDATHNHMGNFFDCIETRNTPISDVVSQHRSASACHLANISMRLGRKLIWDPKRELFVGNDKANGWLSREQRNPYEIKA